jgi:hypothetical protein
MAFFGGDDPSRHRDMLDSIRASLEPQQWQYVEDILKATAEMKAETDRAKRAAQNLRVTNKALRAEHGGVVTVALYNMLLSRLGIANDLREDTRQQLAACVKALGLKESADVDTASIADSAFDVSASQVRAPSRARKVDDSVDGAVATSTVSVSTGGSARSSSASLSASDLEHVRFGGFARPHGSVTWSDSHTASLSTEGGSSKMPDSTVGVRHGAWH